MNLILPVLTYDEVKQLDTVGLLTGLASGTIDRSTAAGWLAERRLKEAGIDPNEPVVDGEDDECPF